MPDYIDPPEDVDPEALAEQSFDYLQGVYPAWAPADGNYDTRFLQAVARINSVVARLASGPPTSIFRTLGAKLHRIPPIDAAAATADTTWTMKDTAGYTIHAGTQVGVRAAGDTLIAFTVLTDVIVPPASLATGDGEVTIVAVTPGAEASGLGAPAGEVELIDALDYVTAIELVNATAGGVDAESDSDYLDRLVGKLRLLAPRPIVPSDFEQLAQDTPGIARALALDGYNPDASELQTVTVAGATGGTFTLTFTGQTTAGIARNASAATVQTALEALSNIAPGDIVCTGGPLGTDEVTVEFGIGGAYDGTNVAEMTANGASLTGTSPTVTVATLRDGSPRTDNERYVTVAVADETGSAVSTDAKSEVDATLQAQREINFVVKVIDPTYTQIDVTFVAVAFTGFDPADVEARAEAAVTAFLDRATWGLPRTGDQHVWIDQPIVRFQDLSAVLNNVEGLDHWTALTFAEHGDSLATTDVTMTGPAALPIANTISGTVT